MALLVQRLDEAIKAAGIPIHGVQRLNDGSILVDFKEDEVTPAQRIQAQAIVLAFDSSEPAEAARVRTDQKAKARASVDEPEPIQRMARAIARVLFMLAQEQRTFANGLRLFVLGQGPMPAALPQRTWSEFVDAVKQQIDSE